MKDSIKEEFFIIIEISKPPIKLDVGQLINETNYIQHYLLFKKLKHV